MRKLYLIVVLAFVALACNKEQNHIETDAEGASLTLKLSLADFNLGGPDVSTRSLSYDERLAKINKSEIHSLAAFIMKVDPIDGANSRVIAYRLFLDEVSVGRTHKNFFFNINDFKREDDPSHTIDNIALESVLDGIDPATYCHSALAYADNKDDSDIAAAYPECGINRIDPGNKTAEIHFDFMNPLHGKTEKLRAGTYYLFVVANFRESPSAFENEVLGWWIKESIAYWIRHEHDDDFDGIPFRPVADPKAAGGYYKGFSNVVNGRIHTSDATVVKVRTDYDPMLGFIPASHEDVITSPSNMRNAESDIISTFAGRATLAHGDNEHNHKLLRTLSRATFNIRNQGTLPIQISDFSLSNNFSSAATYLIAYRSEIDNKFANSPTWMGQPDVTSPRSILPYNSSVIYPADGSENVFFDALLLDVFDDDPLSYELEVYIPGYPSSTYECASDDPLNLDDLSTLLADDAWAVGTSKYFLMRSQVNTVNGASGRMMFIKYNEDNDRIMVDTEGTSDASELDRIKSQIYDYVRTEFIWEFTKVSDTEIKIKNLYHDKYLKLDGASEKGDKVQSTPDPALASVFTIHNYKTSTNTDVDASKIDINTVAFTSNTTAEVYLNVLGNNSGSRLAGECVSLSKWNDWGSHFFIYPVDETVVYNTKKRVHIPVIAFNEQLGVPYTLYNLHRNEHLNVQINVSFNDQYQDLDIEALAFTKKENTIDFH